MRSLRLSVPRTYPPKQPPPGPPAGDGTTTTTRHHSQLLRKNEVLQTFSQFTSTSREKEKGKRKKSGDVAGCGLFANPNEKRRKKKKKEEERERRRNRLLERNFSTLFHPGLKENPGRKSPLSMKAFYDGSHTCQKILRGHDPTRRKKKREK